MTDENFEKIANNLIENISSQIEAQDTNYQIDINYSNEVLSLEINGKIYVINKQTPKSEIWLASPISGPYHYHLSNNSWIDSKGSELRSVLSNELSILLNRKIEIT